MTDAIVQQLADRAAIQALVQAYAYAVDTRDWHRYRDCFAGTLQMDFSAASGAPSGYETLSGDEWVARCAAFFSRLDATQHIPALLKLDLDGDRAEAAMQLHAQHFKAGQDGGAVQTMIGRYEMSLARLDGQWRITRMELHVSWQEGNPRVVLQAFGLE
jgi:thioredoxin-like negative regulator of GroEL